MKWNTKTDTLALMVGHGRSLDGSWDPGCTYGIYTEAGLMLHIVQEAVSLLRKSGVKVITDADDANNRNMKASVAWANNKKARLYMSVHCDNRVNATTKAPTGIAPLYVSAAGKKFADAVGKYIAKKLDMKWLGAHKRTDLYELNATDMTSCILETGFIKADLKKLKAAKTYGRTLAKAILKYIGVPVYVSKQTQLRRKEAEILAYMNAHHFKYTRSWKDCAMTWKGAKKLRRANCSCTMSYCAQEVHLLEPGQIFWFNKTKIVCKGKGTKKTLKKNFRILTPRKTPKNADLKRGDFTCSGSAHTQAFGGMSGGHPTWYSWAPSDVGKKQPRHKKSYDKRKVTIVMRPK